MSATRVRRIRGLRASALSCATVALTCGPADRVPEQPTALTSARSAPVVASDATAIDVPVATPMAIPPPAPPSEEERRKAWQSFRETLATETIRGHVVFAEDTPRFSSAKRAERGSSDPSPPPDASRLLAAQVVKDHGGAVEVRSLPRYRRKSDGSYEVLDIEHCVAHERVPLTHLDMRYFVRRADLVPVVRAPRQETAELYRYTVTSGSPIVLPHLEARVSASFHMATTGFEIGLSYEKTSLPNIDRGASPLDAFSVRGPIVLFGQSFGVEPLQSCTPDKWCSFSSSCSHFYVRIEGAERSVYPPRTGGGDGIAAGSRAYRVRSGSTVYWETGGKAGKVERDTWLFHGGGGLLVRREPTPELTRSKDGKTCVPLAPYQERICFDVCQEGSPCLGTGGLIPE